MFLSRHRNTRGQAERKIRRGSGGAVVFAFGAALAMIVSVGAVLTERYLERQPGNTPAQVFAEQILAATEAYERPLSTAEVLYLIGRLISVTSVTGARVYGNGLQDLGTVGDAPFDFALRDDPGGKPAVREAGDCCLDVFVDRSRSGLGFDLALRIDRTAFGTAPGLSLSLLAEIAIATSLLGALAMTFLYRKWVLRPLDRFAEIVSDAFGQQASISTSVGGGITARVADAVSERLALEARAGDDRVLLERTVVAELPFEVLQYDPDGVLVAANDAALRLFEASSVEELSARDQAVFIWPAGARALASQEGGDAGDTGDGADPRTVGDLLRDGPCAGAAEIVTVEGRLACQLAARSLRDHCGRRWRNIVVLQRQGTPGFEGAVESAIAGAIGDGSAGSASSETLQYRRALLEKNWQLSSCLALLETPDIAALREARIPVRLDLLIEDWYLAASAVGLIDPATSHEVTPQIVGDPAAVAAIFSHALALAVLISREAKPCLAIFSEPVSAGAVCCTISAEGELADDPQQASEENWQLPLAALNKSLKAYGGQVLSVGQGGERERLSFVIRSRPGAAASAAMSDDGVAA